MGQEEIRFEIFHSRNALWFKRWHIRIRDLSNGNVLLSSTGQSYSRRIDAAKAAEKVQRYAPMADIIEVEK